MKVIVHFANGKKEKFIVQDVSTFKNLIIIGDYQRTFNRKDIERIEIDVHEEK